MLFVGVSSKISNHQGLIFFINRIFFYNYYSLTLKSNYKTSDFSVNLYSHRIGGNRKC